MSGCCKYGGICCWRNSASSHFSILLSCGSGLPVDYVCHCLFALILLLRLTLSPSLSRASPLVTLPRHAAAGRFCVSSFCVLLYTLCRCPAVDASPQSNASRSCISEDLYESFIFSWLRRRERSRPTVLCRSGVYCFHPPDGGLVGLALPSCRSRCAVGVADAQQALCRRRSVGQRERRVTPAWHAKLRETKLRLTRVQASAENDGVTDTVVSVQKLNKENSDSGESAAVPEIFSIVLDHQGKLCFREGQSVGVIPRLPLTSAAAGVAKVLRQGSLIAGSEKGPRNTKFNVRPRLYSIASGRQGDDGAGNTFTLCVKRHLYWNPVTGTRESSKDGLCSNYICSVRPGDSVAVSGPVGKALLLPAQGVHPLVMLGTGTGVAPFRGHLAHICSQQGSQDQRKRIPFGARNVLLFLGSRSAASLPYIEEWQALKDEKNGHGVDVHFAWSRPADGAKKTYIQDLIWAERGKVWDALAAKKGHLYACGLKEMLVGVESVLKRIAAERQLEEGFIIRQLKMERRWHVEVY